MTSTAVRPFTLSVPDAVLDDLRDRLRRTRWPDEIADSGWTYGTNLAYQRELVDYWLNQYDWRKHEAELNRWPQFTAPVAGLDLHFVHVRGKGPNPVPLLISHGWPGSFYEMQEVIGPLSDPAAHGGDPADAFDVVVPSLPGYGFSQASTSPGMTPYAAGDLLVRLMTETLGYDRFVAQGGDWGAIITASIAYRHPDRLIAIQMNMAGARPYLGPGAPPLTEEEQAYTKEREGFQNEETGYQRIQGTRPQTLAYGLTDSPVGLAGWIIEKFRAWSDSHGDIESAFTKDQLLTNIMIYWIAGNINSSIRFYYESAHNPWRLGPGERIETPTGYASYPGEAFRPQRSFIERAFNLVEWRDMPKGGHFAAMEQPALYVEAVRDYFRRFR